MAARRAADSLVTQQVEVCDICGATGFEECLAVCTQCNERAEHIYCMQALCDAVPLNWVCEGCKKSITLQSCEVQIEGDPCANLMTNNFKESENVKTLPSQTSARTTGHQEHNNRMQGREEAEMQIALETRTSSDGVSKKLSCLLLSAEGGSLACTSDEGAAKSRLETNCSRLAPTCHHPDSEGVWKSLTVEFVLGKAPKPGLDNFSVVDAHEYSAQLPAAAGALEHLSPTSSTRPGGICFSPVDPNHSLPRNTEHVSPLKPWHRNGSLSEPHDPFHDNVEVIDMEIDMIGDFPLPPLPPGSPPVQPAPAETLLEPGMHTDFPVPPLPPDSPPVQPSPQTPLEPVTSTYSLLPSLPPAQPSPAKTLQNQCHLNNDSPGLACVQLSRLPTPLLSHQEGDCSKSTNLESIGFGLDKKRPRPACHAANMDTTVSRNAHKKGLQCAIFQTLSDAAGPSRQKRWAPSKKQDSEVESQVRSHTSPDGLKCLGHHTASFGQEVNDYNKKASSECQLHKDGLDGLQKASLDNVLPAVAEIGLKSNSEAHLLTSNISSRSSSDLPCPSSVKQATLTQEKGDVGRVPSMSFEDGQVARPSSNHDEVASSCSVENRVCAKQGMPADIVRACVDEDLINKVRGVWDTDNVRAFEDVSDNIYVDQLACLPLLPAVESSLVFDTTGILVDPLTQHKLLSDVNWQVMPLVQQLEKPWYRPPLPNLNDLPFASSLKQSASPSSCEDPELTLRLPQYRKHGNIWITIESDTRDCYDENVKLSLSLL